MRTELPNLDRLIRDAAKRLTRMGAKTPDIDARILMQAATGFTHAAMISASNDVLSDDKSELFKGMIERRLLGEPVHRIIGSREFYGRVFSLSEDTLIPRPDTETIIDAILDLCRNGFEPKRILDIGTGSGIIGITLAAELPNVEVVATDISEDALKTAVNNAEKVDVIDRVQFLNSDMFKEISGVFDLVVSNPPYIPKSEICDLDVEVCKHEPVAALDGGVDGLVFFRKFFAEADSCLVSGGLLVIEIGIGQLSALKQLAFTGNWEIQRVYKDLADIERVVVLRPIGTNSAESSGN